MAIVFEKELVSANSSNMLNIIDKIISTSDELNNKIKEFISESSSNLSGEIFNIISKKFLFYSDALTKQKQIYINLKSNIIAANNEMINYMDGHEKIDDSEKLTIKELIDRINYNINYLKSQANDTSLKKNLNILYSTYNQLNKYYKKIEGLEQQDNNSFSKISDVFTDVLNYSKAVGAARTNLFFNFGNRDFIYYSQTGQYVDGKLVKWQSNWKDIEESGCGPTSCAMILATMLHDPSITPETIANKMEENNWSNIGGGFIKNISKLYGANCVHGRFSADAIEQVIKNGGGFIGSARNGGHYVAVTDVIYNDQNERLFVLCDPYPPYNNNKSEPVLVTEKELREQEITMDFYIVPENIEITTTQEDKRIISIVDKNTNKTISL